MGYVWSKSEISGELRKKTLNHRHLKFKEFYSKGSWMSSKINLNIKYVPRKEIQGDKRNFGFNSKGIIL